MPKNKPHHQKGSAASHPTGFSLIEVLFAMLFLTVIVFGVIKLQTSTIVLANAQNKQLQGYFFATQGIEIMEMIGEGEIGVACGASSCDCHLKKESPPPKYIFECPATPAPEDVGDIYQRSIEVDNDSGNLRNAWKVTSRVNWADSTGDHFAEAKRIIYVK